MERMSVGHKLYLSVLPLFLLFAVLFIVFQQNREREFKISSINLKLQNYNYRLEDALHYIGNHNEKTINDFVHKHHMYGLRVTMIDKKGKVFYDNIRKDYSNIQNHSNRQEIIQALSNGSGYDINRNSITLKGDFFYSATYFPQDKFIIRSALPYNNNLTKSLEADQHYIWFTLIVVIALTLILYRFVQRLGRNVTKLRIFASRAEHNESIDTEDLVEFSADELGEIAEKIIKIYKRLQETKEEQTILKRQLTQNIAHELKTPVASIEGYLETILDNPKITSEMKQQFLERCYSQSKRLSSLLHDISTLNRLDDAPHMIDFEPVNINNIVENIKKDTAIEMAKRNMTLLYDLPKDLIVNGNTSLLYSIFRNLTDNAIAYAGDGTTINIKASENDDFWNFIFYDNGVGVGAEHLGRLFERFYRVDKGRSRKVGGTGLGLAIVKNAVIMHKGNITASNMEEGGLKFTFSIKK